MVRTCNGSELRDTRRTSSIGAGEYLRRSSPRSPAPVVNSFFTTRSVRPTVYSLSFFHSFIYFFRPLSPSSLLPLNINCALCVVCCVSWSGATTTTTENLCRIHGYPSRRNSMVTCLEDPSIVGASTAVPPPPPPSAPSPRNRRLHTAKCTADLHRSCFCVRFIAEHTRIKEESLRVIKNQIQISLSSFSSFSSSSSSSSFHPLYSNRGKSPFIYIIASGNCHINLWTATSIIGVYIQAGGRRGEEKRMWTNKYQWKMERQTKVKFSSFFISRSRHHGNCRYFTSSASIPPNTQYI